MLLVAAVLAAVGVGEHRAEDGAATVKKEEEKPKIALSPELEEKLAEFLKKAGEAKRKVWATRMKAEIGRIVKATGLGEDEAKALEAPAELASEACLSGWTAKLDDSYRQYLNNYEEEQVDQMLAQADQAAQSDWFGDYLRPYEHPKWEEGIRKVLGAEKATAWEQAQVERKEAVRKEGTEVIKASVEATCQQQQAELRGKGAAIRTRLALPKERADQLEALAKTVADASAATLRLRGERMLLAMDDMQRKQTLKARRFYVQIDQKDIEAQQTAWQEGVAGVLAAEEKKRLEETREKFAARRVVVMGKLMITLLDDRIAFTESQRERLQRIAESLVKGQESLFSETSWENSNRLNVQEFFAAGARATEGELRPILDDSQRRHWRDACLPKNYHPNRSVVVAKKADPSGDAKSPTRLPEPEDMENALSDYLHAKTIYERKQLLALNLLKAEDAARVAGLAPECLGRLETAARGVTEATLATWKANTDQNIRSQLQDATPENVKQRLAGIGTYSYERVSTLNLPDAPIWQQAMKSELTAPQQAAWKKELDARRAYREKAISAIIMSEFDRRVSLNEEQWNKLNPIVAGTVKDYAPDIESMFSSSYPYSWYLQSYTMFIPVAAIPEADLKAILGGELWKSWTEGPEMENTNNYWENVQSRHGQRVKEEKK